MITHDRRLTGNIGLYYVCFRLSQEGWIVMPTSRNAKGIDIVAYDTKGTHFITVQVKSLTERVDVPLGSDKKKLMGQWWVIVVGPSTKNPRTYVMTLEEVKKAARPDKQGTTEESWLLPSKEYEKREGWERIRGRNGT